MTEFSDFIPDGDFVESFRTLAGVGGTRTNRKLPAPSAAPEIPERVGAAAHKENYASSSGGVDMTLKGAKTLTSTDGLLTIVFPESAEAVVGGTTIVIPAVSTSA